MQYVSIPLFISLSSTPLNNSRCDLGQAWNSTSSRGGVIFQFILTLSIMVAVGALLSWHFYLLLTNQTT